MQTQYTGEYVAPTPTVDNVIFSAARQRADDSADPASRNRFMEARLPPVATVPPVKPRAVALDRITARVGVDCKQFGLVEQLYTFDTVARGPTRPRVSVTYMSLGPNMEPGQ